MSDMTNTCELGKQKGEALVSLLEMVAKILDNPASDHEEMQALIQQALNLGRENLELWTKQFDQFNELKASAAELETKLAQMREMLDDLRAMIPQGDYNTTRILCEQQYASVWPKLDESSKAFLTTANFLCRKCVGENLDFSPMIVEMSRAYENELLAKIFRDFVNRNASSAPLLPARGKDALFNAVNDVRNGNSFFISLTQMIKIMNRLPQNARNTYGDKLFVDLAADWDVTQLSDTHFYQNGLSYANDYRNRAAHPGTTLSKTDADQCEQLSQDLLGHFIGAMKS